MSPAPVIIVGGGFSGAMLAARLAERGQASVVIDQTGRFGLGVAYSTPFDGHLLNVRSGRMSALAGRPDDFVRWLSRTHPNHADPRGFAPRRLYGLYVQDRLAAVRAEAPALLEVIAGRVSAVEGHEVILADGRRLTGRAVVLATGNPPPRTASGHARIVSDPWAEDALSAVGRDDEVVVIGSGLTMVDMALWLQARGWRGRMTALSRRGLMPRPHTPGPSPEAKPDPGLTSGPASARLAAARRMAEVSDWRSVIDSLRPVTPEAWRQADLTTRARLLRHLVPWWDVHRHRLAPEAARVIDALMASGRLVVAAARILALEADPAQVTVTCRPRGSRQTRTLRADVVIDCSGPGHDPGRDALTAPLLRSGRVRLDPLGLGLDLDQTGRVLSAEGQPDPGLFVLGPPARAAFWETVAVPDIRDRIEQIAETLAAG